MNLLLKFSFFFLFVSMSYANTVRNLVTLPKHFKVEDTFSGDLSEKESFHLIFSKNKQNRKNTVHSFIYDGKTITELQPFESVEKYSLISFHKKQGILSLLLSYKEKNKEYIRRVDINLNTKEIKQETPFVHEDYLSSIRENDRSILIYKTKEEITISQFIGINQPKKFTYTFRKKNDDYSTFFNENKLEAIKTNEFIANGSTANFRVYFDENHLIFTKESTSDNITNVVTVPLDEKDFIPSKIKTFTNKKADGIYKKFTSFYFDSKIYQFGNDKKTGSIKIHHITTNKSKLINVDDSLSSKIKGNDAFAGVTAFLKQAGKNKHKTTITANPTKNNKIKVRVDYVNIDYSYHYNWWWHHQQFMMWQQQNMMRTIPSGFGPSQPNDIYFNTYTFAEEKRYFEILLDSEGNLLNEELPETMYKEIDKKKYIEKLEEIKDFKYESSCFLKNSFRFISYSRKQQGFIFQTNKL
ncbi:hypothetical protein P8625_10990 [Tenacibaculum tangerinum]|uniref:Uncharacterized protein n=1 Tax=Tenacibaculum tangerinum TaxID=3038772 RepID=A0ABY8L000_9FLAO|nr:hypothetical protein [Tenacibaculum tangerinum]WGH74614.1 hypothetical protein P8625_10990 [Tenacibaculum tangerinum]